MRWNVYSKHTQLYRKTSFSCGGRWLMIEIKDEAVLEDVKSLISIRVRPKKKTNEVKNI